MAIQVILADDHPIVLLGVSKALQDAAGIVIAAEANCPKSLLTRLEQQDCDVVVTDFSMPNEDEPDGLKLLARLHQKFPAVAVVVLTKITTPAMITPILQAGALALVEKSAAVPEIAVAIYRAARRQFYFTESIRQQLACIALSRNPPPTRSNLSPREAEVLRLFASGYTNNQIAAMLGVSVKTTSRQKQDAMRKLSARNDAELFAYAGELGLV
jgi:two-component system capsular synthesis response regulator RcsB